MPDVLTDPNRVAEIEEPEPAEAPETPEEPERGELQHEEPAATEAPGEAPAALLSEKQLNQAFEKLAREGKRHRDRLDEIMGEDALALTECPLCSPEMAGWRFPVEPDDATKDLVRAAIGDRAALDYEHAPDANTCPACKGLGDVLTGSLVPDRRTKPCSQCNGWGYVLIPGSTGNANAAAELTVVAPSETLSTEAPPSVDFMGRKRGDPNFGILAGYER